MTKSGGLGFPHDEVCYGFFYFIPPFYTSVKEADISFISASLYGNCLPDGDLDTSLIRMQAFGPMFLTNY